MGNEALQKDLVETLSKYKGEKNGLELISKMRSDVQDIFDRHIDTERGLLVDDFPIDIENEFGKFKITSDGNCFVEPKKVQQFIELNVTIQKTGESYE